MTAQDIVCIAMLLIIVGWAIASIRRVLRQVPRKAKTKRQVKTEP